MSQNEVDDDTSTVVSERNSTTQILISIQEKLNELNTKINKLEENQQQLNIINPSLSPTLSNFIFYLNLDYISDALFDTNYVPPEDIHTDGRFLISKDILISMVFSITYLIICFFIFYNYLKRISNILLPKNPLIHLH